MGGQRWAFFETCNALLRQWEGKSDDFPCFPGRGKPAASQSRSLDTSTVPSNCMKGTAQMLVLLGKHDLHKVLVRSRTCANGFQRTLRGRLEALRGRSEDAQSTFRGRSEDAPRTRRERSEDAQRARRGRAEDAQRRAEAAQRMCRGRSEARSGVVVGS